MAKKPTRTVATLAPVVLPAGYNSPAFQTADGDTLFVERYKTVKWAVSYIKNKKHQRLQHNDLPITGSKHDALIALSRFAAKRETRKVQ